MKMEQEFNSVLKSLPKFPVFHVSKFAPDMTDICLKKFLMEKLEISDEHLFSISKKRRGPL